MEPIKQEDPLGCGVACVAFLLGITFQNTLGLFKDGKKKANETGFICKEIVEVLENEGRQYQYKYIKNKLKKKIYKPGTIVFLKRSNRYPAGHYLCRVDNKWMDPWINFPLKERRAGFRKRLPGKPIYVIYPI